MKATSSVPAQGPNVTTECHLFLNRKLPFFPLLFFSYPTKQPVRHRIRKGKPLTPACHLGTTLLRRSIHLHASGDAHCVYERLTNVASRRDFSLMVESRSIAGVIISTVFKNQIARAHHLGTVKR